MRIETKAVAEKAEVRCPSCSNVLLAVTPGDHRAPDGGYVIEDGDSIYGVWEGLDEAERSRSWDAALSVGTCRKCSERYFFANIAFVEADRSDRVQEHLYQNLPTGPETNFECSIVDDEGRNPRSWIMNEWDSAVGTIHHHWLGPWKRDDHRGVEREWGVTARRSPYGNILDSGAAASAALSIWKQLRDLNAARSRKVAG